MRVGVGGAVVQDSEAQSQGQNLKVRVWKQPVEVRPFATQDGLGRSLAHQKDNALLLGGIRRGAGPPQEFLSL